MVSLARKKIIGIIFGWLHTIISFIVFTFSILLTFYLPVLIYDYSFFESKIYFNGLNTEDGKLSKSIHMLELKYFI